MRNRKKITGRERGSIFVEMLFFLPFIIVIWILLIFIYDAKKAGVTTQIRAQECGWQYAVNGCGNRMPDACDGLTTELMEDGEMRGRAQSQFETVREGAGVVTPNYVNLHGRWFSVLTEKEVQRPAFLGGSTIAEGRFATMCGDETVKDWSEINVFQSVCGENIKRAWCSWLSL